MAGWGTGSFENEHAQNWLGRLSTTSMDDLTGLLRRAHESDYLEAPEASVVVAAAEVIAAASGAPGHTLPREVSDWIRQFEGTPSSELRTVASQAVDNVRKNSELRDLWLQAEGLNEWSSALRDLAARLSG
jgi:hypothetical protein